MALALAVPAAAGAHTGRTPTTALGTLTQLHGRTGCLVDRSTRRRGCTPARALKGPAPFLGSQAVALSPHGGNLYVASSRSNAIAVFRRKARTGRLTQGRKAAGCIAAGGASGCARARGLRRPNSVAVSPDGRNVYATSLVSDAITVFRRNLSSGALTQAKGATRCVAATARAGCAAGRALDGPDVVTVSPDGKNVYVGSFSGNAVAVFARNSSTGGLTQLAGAGGCLASVAVDGCGVALALGAPEGMAISADGDSVYVAGAVSNALLVLTRDPSTGALTQATDGTGCIVATPLTGCTTGTELVGANAVAVSPDDDDVYLTSLTSNSLTSFTRATSGQLAQKSGTSACVVDVLAVGCSLGRELSAPEGLAVSPDGADVYGAAFRSGAVDTFTRNTSSGALIQKARQAGCHLAAGAPACRRGRGLRGVSSLAVSPDGRFLYSAAFASNAVAIFKRVTHQRRAG